MSHICNTERLSRQLTIPGRGERRLSRAPPWGATKEEVVPISAENWGRYPAKTRMFGVRNALVALTGVLPRGAQQGDIISTVRLYGREMHVLAVMKRAGDVEPVTLNVLSTVWGRLKGKGGSTFGRFTTNLFAEPPTAVAYDEMAKKKATAYGVKAKGILAFAPEWEYDDGQGGMATIKDVKDYQLIPTVGWTVIQQAKYLEALHRAALDDGSHLRTSSTIDALHVAPINCPLRTTRGTSRTPSSKLIVRPDSRQTSQTFSQFTWRRRQLTQSTQGSSAQLPTVNSLKASVRGLTPSSRRRRRLRRTSWRRRVRRKRNGSSQPHALRTSIQLPGDVGGGGEVGG